MLLSELTSAQAVREALAEFDRLGREAFLRKYGFRRARAYFVEYDGRLYDSKAIVGAAFGRQHPGRGALKPSDFSGGEATVKAKLEQLSFSVRVLGPVKGATSERVGPLAQDAHVRLVAEQPVAPASGEFRHDPEPLQGA